MLEIPADRIMFADMDVVGSCSYPTSAWSSVVRLLEHGLLDLDPIVTHRFPADRFEDAFALMDSRDGVVAKVVLEHPDDLARRPAFGPLSPFIIR